MKRTVAFHTLGCKVNQYETEAMAELFTSAGYSVGDFDGVCDVYVINTCTVTGTGDKKSRQVIRRAQSTNPDAVIAVTGCYSQVAPDEIAALGVDVILGSKDKSQIVALVENALDGKSVNAVTDIMKSKIFEDMRISSFSDKARAFVKIEDGCNSFCTYCIIPYARGPVRSRKLTDIVDEVRSLADAGFAEVVLTGIHIASYGIDIKDESINLGDVIEAIHSIPGIQRIRLGSIEPRILTEDFVRKLAAMPKVCNHFHISLQSGCDATLRRMNRKYTTTQYRDVVGHIRKYIPDSAITTDIMVGFPGETDEEFAESMQFLKDIGFAESHVFAYSNRKGTRADKFPDQIKRTAKNKRAAAMAEAAEECRVNFLTGFIGKRIEVLAEREVESGIYEGHTSNYIKVHIPSSEDISRTFVSVTLDSIDGDHMIGSLCE